ncbi:MAG TPA: DUF998 domain-containing protein [Candidatus Limnocylindrales bacterium]
MVRPLALFGLAGAVCGPLAVGLLHVMPPTDRINPVRRTISEYALHETGWLFNAGVLGLAIGSFAVVVALALAGVIRLNSLGGLALLLWCAGLAAVVYFPKHNWSVGPSTHGTVHRIASLVAFVSLPLGALLIAWAWRRHEAWRRRALWTAGFAVLALAFFGVIAGAFALQPFTGVSWWRAIPLGAVERALATAEICVVLSLGWWASTSDPQRLHRKDIESHTMIPAP